MRAPRLIVGDRYAGADARAAHSRNVVFPLRGTARRYAALHGRVREGRARRTASPRSPGEGIDLRDVLAGVDARCSLQRVPHYMTPCWYTLDPASLLVTSHLPGRTCRSSRRSGSRTSTTSDDVHKIADVARSERGHLDPARGHRRRPAPQPALARCNMDHRRRSGADRRAAHRGRRGLGCCSASTASPGEPMFDPDEIALPARRSRPYLAEGARRGLLVGEASRPRWPEAPGLVVLRRGLERRVAHARRRALARRAPRRRLGARAGCRRPCMAVAGRALRTAEDADAPGEVALARVLSRVGHLGGAARRGARRRRRDGASR